MLVAAHRARETAAAEPLCRDPWAEALAGEEGPQLAELHDSVYPAGTLWIALRTAWIDDRIARLTAPHGEIGQIVILGAGFDTRAARLGGPGRRFFEVDAPGSAALKQQRLADLPAYPVNAATYVVCDFETEDFLDRLSAAGFDRSTPALFVWEGVTPYLTETAVRATAARVAGGCHPRTVLVFDLLGRRMVEAAKLAEDDAKLRAMVQQLGEPFRFGVDDPVPLLTEAGFGQVKITTFDEICLAYTGTYDRRRKFRFQLMVEAQREHGGVSW
jgi:methyltransferase (TIGR00027 family)